MPFVRAPTLTRDCLDLRGVTDAGNAQVRQIALVHRNAVGRDDVLDVARHDVPGHQSAILGIGADQHDHRRATGGLAPFLKCHAIGTALVTPGTLRTACRSPPESAAESSKLLAP